MIFYYFLWPKTLGITVIVILAHFNTGSFLFPSWSGEINLGIITAYNYSNSHWRGCYFLFLWRLHLQGWIDFVFTARLRPGIQWLVTDRPSDSRGSVQRSAPENWKKCVRNPSERKFSPSPLLHSFDCEGWCEIEGWHNSRKLPCK